MLTHLRSASLALYAFSFHKPGQMSGHQSCGTFELSMHEVDEQARGTIRHHVVGAPSPTH